jgi:hypothetical protein
MVTFIRGADVNGIEKQQKAVEWAKSVAHYVDGRFGFSNVACGVEIYGSAGRFYWIGRQESLESLGKGAEEALTDQGYQQMLQKGSDLFVPGSVRDTVIVGI